MMDDEFHRAIAMDTKKMRICSVFLGDPGERVVGECLDAIEALRAENERLREIIETHALPPGCECVPCKRIREEMKALRGEEE
jgi:hypothetical protein